MRKGEELCQAIIFLTMFVLVLLKEKKILTFLFMFQTLFTERMVLQQTGMKKIRYLGFTDE